MGVMSEYSIIDIPGTMWQIYLIKVFRCHVQNFWIGLLSEITQYLNIVLGEGETEKQAQNFAKCSNYFGKHFRSIIVPKHESFENSTFIEGQQNMKFAFDKCNGVCGPVHVSLSMGWIYEN